MSSKNNEPIAQINLLRITPIGNKLPLRIQIGKPFKNDTAWQCAVSMEGIGQSPLNIYGENSLQSLA